ncbi:dual specificity protein phosphatase [Thermanaerothrix sp.]|jgi:rhodanese-related sulfurtransferase|uniref:protein-tyrosine phosphatase family protein n=1 Tax=Thermanaerothrix sp. TaxID=2972675 RepID=UPI002ADE7B28|nr:dual specificity protein phosphatase [Thermanaerothrix sp.]
MTESDVTVERRVPLVKGMRILVARLFEQGVRTTGWWLLNLFCRVVLDRPLRRLSQVAPGLFVGGQYKARGKRILEQWGIKAVVNLRQEFDDRAAGLAPQYYLHLPTIDDQAPTLEDLSAGVKFIHSHIEAGRSVYVHCASGVGRAPTLAAAYLVSRGYPVAQAWAIIRRARPFIRPTAVQYEQVERFARWWAEHDSASSFT